MPTWVERWNRLKAMTEKEIQEEAERLGIRPQLGGLKLRIMQAEFQRDEPEKARRIREWFQ